MSLFPSIFCPIAVFSVYGEYVVRSFLPNGVFLPCDHGLDFWHQLMWEFNQSINQSINQSGDDNKELLGKVHFATQSTVNYVPGTVL